MAEGNAGSGKQLGQQFLRVAKFALLIGILVAVGLFSALVGMRIAVQGTEISAPEILGKSQQEAESLLKASNLGMEVLATRYDSEVPERAVVSQSPAAGGRIKAGRNVRVVVSLGARQHPVPSLVGGSLRVARAKLLQSEYHLGSVSEILLPHPAGESGRENEVSPASVLQQYPSAGIQESGGARVDLLVARRAPAGYLMPDVVGSTLNQVYALFEGRGFRVGTIRYRKGTGKPKWTVLRQFPEAGSKLEEKDEIHVEVAN
ncbi:MAG: PASTA domain-containing protein [Acidobacteriota bacterium]